MCAAGRHLSIGLVVHNLWGARRHTHRLRGLARHCSKSLCVCVGRTQWYWHSQTGPLRFTGQRVRAPRFGGHLAFHLQHARSAPEVFQSGEKVGPIAGRPRGGRFAPNATDWGVSTLECAQPHGTPHRKYEIGRFDASVKMFRCQVERQRLGRPPAASGSKSPRPGARDCT